MKKTILTVGLFLSILSLSAQVLNVTVIKSNEETFTKPENEKVLVPTKEDVSIENPTVPFAQSDLSFYVTEKLNKNVIELTRKKTLELLAVGNETFSAYVFFGRDQIVCFENRRNLFIDFNSDVFENQDVYTVILQFESGKFYKTYIAARSKFTTPKATYFFERF